MNKYAIPVRRKIKLASVTDMKNFNAICTRTESEVDVIAERYIVDGKSLLGLCSLDLTKVLEVVLYSDDDEEIGTFLLRIGKWMVEE